VFSGFSVWKLKKRRVAERAGLPAMLAGAERMRAILDDRESMPLGDRQYRVHVARQPIEVRRHHRDGAAGDRAFEGPWIQVERARIHVRRHGCEPGDPDHSGITQKVSAGTITSAPGAKAERLEDVVERHASVRRGHRVGHAEPIRQGAFEAGDVGTLDQPAAPAAVRDDRVAFPGSCADRSGRRRSACDRPPHHQPLLARVAPRHPGVHAARRRAYGAAETRVQSTSHDGRT
jgi:hypothetical protein